MKIIEKIKNIKLNKKILFLVFLFIIILLSTPLMNNTYLAADDYLFHMARIQSIADQISLGSFPVKVHFFMLNSAGYGTGLFYPNTILYLVALIKLICKKAALAYKIFQVIYLIALFWISFYSMNSIFKDKKKTLLSSILIMFSRALILNLYDRTAMGELLGFLFMPPVIAGMVNYIRDDFNKPYILAFGFLGLISSHLISSIIMLCFAIIYFLINIKSTLKNPKKFLKLIIVAILVLLLSAYFWAPMIEQLLNQTFKLSNPWTDISNDPFNLSDLFGIGRYSLGLIFTICIPFLIVCIILKDYKKENKEFLIWSLCLCFLMIFNPFWKLTSQFTNVIQFKWRLLGITTIFLSISVPLILEYFSLKFKFSFKLGFIIIFCIDLVLLIINLNGVISSHNTMSYDYVETLVYSFKDAIGGGQEYLPIDLDYQKLVDNINIVYIDNGLKTAMAKEDLKGICFLEESYNAKEIVVPLVYYKGYVANLTSIEGEVTPLEVIESDKNDENAGLVKIKIPEGKWGTIQVWYQGTKIQKYSDYLSLFTLIAILIYSTIYIIIKKRNKS